MISKSPYRAIKCTGGSVEGFSVVIIDGVPVTLEEIQCIRSRFTGKNDGGLEEEKRSERSMA